MAEQEIMAWFRENGAPFFAAKISGVKVENFPTASVFFGTKPLSFIARPHPLKTSIVDRTKEEIHFFFLRFEVFGILQRGRFGGNYVKKYVFPFPN